MEILKKHEDLQGTRLFILGKFKLVTEKWQEQKIKKDNTNKIKLKN